MADFTYATIARCLAAFNFERVHTMMVAVDWKWSLGSGPDGLRVPDIQDLMNTAERLLYAAVRDQSTVSTGGFEARYWIRHERACISLRFVGAERHEHFDCDSM